jgi:hypothetical protein
MGAKGNQFWKLRLKHGRDTIIKSPEELWSNFIEYAQWIEDNPLLEVDFRGKDATQVVLPKMRPMLKSTFAIMCGYSCWDNLIEVLKTKDGFSQIITRIEACIYSQKLEGAASGFFNSNIIARELGLTDKQENKLTSDKPIIITLTEKGGA